MLTEEWVSLPESTRIAFKEKAVTQNQKVVQSDVNIGRIVKDAKNLYTQITHSKELKDCNAQILIMLQVPGNAGFLLTAGELSFKFIKIKLSNIASRSIRMWENVMNLVNRLSQSQVL
jgi:hypothetical protein